MRAPAVRSVVSWKSRRGSELFPDGFDLFWFLSNLEGRKSPFFLPMLGLACLIAFSRVSLYVHYPSDVLAGAILGGALGELARIPVDLWYRTR